MTVKRQIRKNVFLGKPIIVLGIFNMVILSLVSTAGD